MASSGSVRMIDIAVNFTEEFTMGSNIMWLILPLCLVGLGAPALIGLSFCSGVAHSFTGSAQDSDRLLSFNNLNIGLNGCSLRTAENLDVVKGIPLGRLMIETDSPYCEIKNTHAGISYVKSSWPSKKKEKYDPECIIKGRNEPCLVRQVLEVVAGCKGIADIDQLSKTLYHNTCRIFFPQDLDSAADALLNSGQNAF